MAAAPVATAAKVAKVAMVAMVAVIRPVARAGQRHPPILESRRTNDDEHRPAAS
jgi:hypothetical protein